MEFFKSLFPLLFAYAFRSLTHIWHSNHNSVPIWVLINKEKGYLSIVLNEHPDRGDLFRFRGHVGVSTAEAHIYLGQESAPLQIQD